MGPGGLPDLQHVHVDVELFVNKAVFGVFDLEVTEILLIIGNFSRVKGGGIAGVVSPAVAWYTSSAGAVAGAAGRPFLPVGMSATFEPPASS